MDRKRLLPLIILQIIPLLIFPPSLLLSGLILVVILGLVFALLGWGLLQGKSWALTLSILLQGLNVIIRLMMFFPNSVDKNGFWDIPFVLTSLIAITASAWFMLRLDKADIRSLIYS